MKIYTKHGDNCYTYLLGGKMVIKNHLKIVACGSIDKANAYIGHVASNERLPDKYKIKIYQIMRDLFNIGAELSLDCNKKNKFKIKNRLSNRKITEIEIFIDNLEMDLLPLQKFVLPIGCELSIKCNLARVEIRQAELSVVALNDKYFIRSEILCYLNRLSDLFFVLFRYFNLSAKKEELF